VGLFGKLKSVAGGATDKAAELAVAGFEKLTGPVNDLGALGPAVEKVGYRVGEIELEAGLPPRVIVHLTREFEAGDEAFQAAFASLDGNRTATTVLYLLQQANRVVGKVHIKGRRLRGVEVSLGLPPSIRFKYAEVPVAPLPKDGPRS